jgi:hypothetical protein
MINIHLARGLETGVIAGFAAGALLGLSQYTKFLAVFLNVTLFHIYLGHFVLSIILGVIFSYTFGKKIGSHERSLFSGIIYGIIIWLVASSILWIASPVIRETGLITLVPLLWMNLIYGLMTGLIYDLIVPDSEQEKNT